MVHFKAEMTTPPKSTQNLPPIFVRSNLTFEHQGKIYSYSNQGCSLYGFSSLQAQAFDPTDHVGEMVKLTVDVLHTDSFQFSTSASITSEVTTDTTYLGLKFYLGDVVRNRLAQAIKNGGYYPTDYVRKYPRIPAKEYIASMPLRAIVSGELSEYIVFDVANMSPNGLLLNTENPKALLLIPGMRINGQVEPRGGTSDPFDFQGLVCRMLMDKNPKTDNLRRFLGIKITFIPPEQRQTFLEILKSVLNNIQSEGLVRET